MATARGLKRKRAQDLSGANTPWPTISGRRLLKPWAPFRHPVCFGVLIHEGCVSNLRKAQMVGRKLQELTVLRLSRFVFDVKQGI